MIAVQDRTVWKCLRSQTAAAEMQFTDMSNNFRQYDNALADIESVPVLNLSINISCILIVWSLIICVACHRAKYLPIRWETQ